jgi:hypothetical protein
MRSCRQEYQFGGFDMKTTAEWERILSGLSPQALAVVTAAVTESESK